MALESLPYIFRCQAYTQITRCAAIKYRKGGIKEVFIVGEHREPDLILTAGLRKGGLHREGVILAEP